MKPLKGISGTCVAPVVETVIKVNLAHNHRPQLIEQSTQCITYHSLNNEDPNQVHSKTESLRVR